MDAVRKLSVSANKVLNNNYVKAAIPLFLVLYSSLARPQLPQFVMDLFDNSIFRLAILTLVVFMGNGNIQIALLTAVAFTITLSMLNEQKIAEGFVNGIKEGMITENFDDEMDSESDVSDSELDDIDDELMEELSM